MGRISNGEGDGHFGKGNQNLKRCGGEEYQVVGNFVIHPWFRINWDDVVF